jgi:hypothetical protein
MAGTTAVAVLERSYGYSRSEIPYRLFTGEPQATAQAALALGSRVNKRQKAICWFFPV